MNGLNKAMTATRVIMGYTIIILMIANIWKTLMITLGVGVMLYEDNEEEKERMEKQTETIYHVYETGEYTKTSYINDPKLKEKWYIHSGKGK